MADYRQDKEVKNRFMRIGIPLLLLSLITIYKGVRLFLNASPTRAYYYCDLVFAIIIVVAGIIGVLGALHRYKALPEGEYCCYPGRMTPISPVGSLLLWTFSAFLLYGYYNTSDLSLGGVLFFGVLQVILFFLSMVGFFYCRIFGIVGAGERFYILGIKGIEEHNFSEIAYTSTRAHISYKVFNHDNKYWFRILALWPGAVRVMESLDRHQVPLKSKDNERKSR